MLNLIFSSFSSELFCNKIFPNLHKYIIYLSIELKIDSIKFCLYIRKIDYKNYLINRF